MANELFEEQGQYGDVSAMQELTREAPISGAPLPGQATTAKPAAPGGPAPAPAGVFASPYSAPQGGVDYYQHLAATFAKLARSPGAGPALKKVAADAKAQLRNRESGRA